METPPATHKASPALLRSIAGILAHNGLKATTMDSVAASLQMSKRTLYEIFGSKADMISAALAFTAEDNRRLMEEIFRTQPNVIMALLEIFRLHRDFIESVSAEFFRDMDHYYKNVRRDYDRSGVKRHRDMQKLFALGVRQGVFRRDVDYLVMSRMMEIQMESLKRMEEFFPPDITLLRAFDAIIIGFLRSIASEKGARLLDTHIKGASLEKSDKNH